MPTRASDMGEGCISSVSYVTGECGYDDDAFEVQLVRLERLFDSRAAESTLSVERVSLEETGRSKAVSSVRTVIRGGGALRNLRAAGRLSALSVASRSRPFSPGYGSGTPPLIMSYAETGRLAGEEVGTSVPLLVRSESRGLALGLRAKANGFSRDASEGLERADEVGQYGGSWRDASEYRFCGSLDWRNGASLGRACAPASVSGTRSGCGCTRRYSARRRSDSERSKRPNV